MARQSQQTDAIINHMRLEQRAWIAAVAPTLPELIAEKDIIGEFKAANSGKTPGTIVQVRHRFFKLTSEAEIERVVALIAAEIAAGMGSDNKLSIAPGSSIAFPVIARPGPEPDVFNAIMKGDQILAIIGQFVYEDGMGTKRATQYCFVFDRLRDPKDKRLVTHAKYNYMT
jgi:hypothetical protein